MIGKTLAHYEITALLGKGGMGEVYRARDSKLGRDVAIKILPTELSGDPERAARFDREARTLASLQHPAVASIYGYEEVENTRFLVMELVEGEDLSLRMGKGKLPLDEVKRIARQIATGLEAAHDRGIVHRDLKPANIMLNEAGEAKILDFGLARAWFGDMGDADMENSPTITAAMTQAGTILGTAAYMSPEQARGRNVDRRADIWAFGAILWEMVTGKRLFEGETVSDTLAAVLRAEPEWALLPVDEAPELCRLIERCLIRDPRQRLRDIGEARILLQDGNESSLLMPALDLRDSAGRPSRGGWYVALAMTAVAVVLAAMYLTRGPERALTQATLGLLKEDAISLSGGTSWTSVEISPDGESVVYVGGSVGRLYLRNVDSFESTLLEDTENARMPVFSPDGRWIAYRDFSKLMKIAVSGGAPVEICDTRIGPGLAWGNGEIYFSRTNGGGLWAVSENGGEPRSISTLNEANDETSHRWPYVLPDGRHLLLTIKTARIGSFDDASIGLLSLDTGDVKVLLTGGSNPRYVPTGHILYGRNFQLFAVPFDVESLTVQGTPTPVLDGVHVSDLTGSTHYAVSPQGHLVYVPTLPDFWDFRIAWANRSGQYSEVDVDERRAIDAAFSPDGERFAAVVPAANDKVWIFDLVRKTSSRLSTTPGNDRDPIWSPDGKSIVYRNDLSGTPDLYVIPADGSAPAEVLLASEFFDSPSSWSPDGKSLLFTRMKPDGDTDIMTLSMTGEREVAPFLATSQSESTPRFHPSGRWIAYESNASGERNVYVRPYPGPGSAVRVSRTNGWRPEWTQDGTTLFYMMDEWLISVPVDVSAGFRAGEPQGLFNMGKETARAFAIVAPAPDGKRFLVIRSNLDGRQYQIRVVFDWTDRLRDI